MNIINETIPAPCAACNERMPVSGGFCEACFGALPLIKADVRCPACGAENDGIFDVCSKCLKEDDRVWSNAVSVMRMEGLGRDLIHRFKYGGDTSLAKALGKLAAAALEDSMFNVDLIAPVPLHWSRALTRGYNQTALLCETLSTETGIPTRSLLKRVRRTPKQASLDRAARMRNLRGAFAVRRSAKKFKNRKILLVDDVLTTGSTLAEAASTLNSAGFAEIRVLTLLRA